MNCFKIKAIDNDKNAHACQATLVNMNSQLDSFPVYYTATEALEKIPAAREFLTCSEGVRANDFDLVVVEVQVQG